MVATMGRKVNLDPLAKITPLPHIPNNCSPKNILEVSSLVSPSSHALDTPLVITYLSSIIKVNL